MDASGDGPRVPASGRRRAVPSARFKPPAVTPPPADQGDAASPPADGTGGPGPGAPGAGRPDRQPEFRRAATWIVTVFVGAVAAAVGNNLTTTFEHSPWLMFAVLGVAAIVACACYLLSLSDVRRLARRARRALGRSVPDLPSRPPAPSLGLAGAARWLVVGGVVVAVGLAFLVGYWVIGNGFAQGALPGTLTLLGAALLVALPLAWAHRRRAPRWLSWLRPWRNGVLVIGVSALGLSAGGTLGDADLAPGPPPAAQCPPPTELRVLAAADILGPLQSAITEFEQDERTVLHASCYAVDVTAYAADTDKAADGGIAGGWDLADGPRPDIWIPASTEELPAGATGARQPAVDTLGSIASSPIVIAVPSPLVTGALRPEESNESLARVYQAVSGGFTLQVPNPRLSETARLGIADLYPSLSPAERRRIGQSASYPPDSGSLLCQAAPAAPTAYLVSAAAVFASNHDGLTAPACLSLPSGQQRLTAFDPVDGSVLDFPFATLRWPGAPVSRARAAAEHEFYNWLASRAGGKALTRNGMGPGGAEANLPPASSVTAAVAGFTQSQPPARILVAIDDSLPMKPYLGQIAQAVGGVLGPRAQGGNLSGKDSFGVWTFPGGGSGTEQAAVPLAPGGPAQQARVPGAVAAIKAHGHSAEFDLAYDAALSLNSHAPPDSASSLVLLTDGDNQQTDPAGNNIGKVTTLLRDLAPGNLPIKVYVIAFGPSGCAETPSGLAADSLNALAKAGGGDCVAAASGSLQQQLAQDISTLSTGG